MTHAPDLLPRGKHAASVPLAAREKPANYPLRPRQQRYCPEPAPVAVPPRSSSREYAERQRAGLAQLVGLAVSSAQTMPFRALRAVRRARNTPSRERQFIIALLPAWNEEAAIGRAISCLFAQSHPVDRIIVIANNCTDRTAEVAAAVGAEVMIMTGNQHKKAGALNYALRRLLPGLRDEDAILVQDADSFLDPGFVAATSAKLRRGFGAAGGNFYGREGGGLCGALQRNEYARYARDTARKRGDVLCITGVGTLFRVKALRDVAAGIRDGRLPDSNGGFIYSYSTQTEDNWMTLALKHLGYKVISPKTATMSTEVMMTWRELAVQRTRWKRGAFEDLLSFGITRHTIKGWTLQVVAILGILASLAYFATLGASPWLGFHVHPLFLGLTVFYAIERAVTVRSRGWKIALLSMTVVGEWTYDLYLQFIQLRALIRMMFRASSVWR